MFIVIVHYKAPLSAIDAAFARHQGWLQQGYHDGIILLSGPQVPRTGGFILAHGVSRGELERRLAQDPFATGGLVEHEIIEVAARTADPRLEFLLAANTRQ